MKAYKISGTFKMGSVEQNPFTIELAAKRKDEAVNKLYSILGSKHGVKRREVKITEVKSLKKEEIEDPVVRYQVTGE